MAYVCYSLGTAQSSHFHELIDTELVLVEEFFINGLGLHLATK